MNLHADKYTKGNGNLVRVNVCSSYPGFKLTRLYCIDLSQEILAIDVLTALKSFL